MPKFNKHKVLKNYTELNKQLMFATTDDVKELKEALDKEMKGQRRLSFILRIHSRFTRMRSKVEVQQYLHKMQTGE